MAPKSVQRSSTPTGVQAAALSSDSVRVWWSANPEAVAAYVVQRDGYGWYWDADRRQSAYGQHFVTLCRSATTTCDVGNLSRGATVTLHVAAENADGRLSGRTGVTVTTLS
ncbi:MAG: fibronectin type III domain-containing protein [Actinomycetota bacterium]|nr:fibronectin type III domain-containing protein [Actinomycetota bacterium]